MTKRSLSAEETLDHLSKFVRGSFNDRSGHEGDLVKSGLQLLQSLPAARSAVLQYITDIYDDAVNQHLEQRAKNGSCADRPVIDDIHHALMNYIHEKPCIWAPRLSSWSVDCLGSISSKYSGRHMLPHTSSLNELLLVWMSCPPTRSLVQITSECFISTLDTDASGYVDSLIDASVRHSPHFDWIVAHIGSCFPQAVISRVLLCGLQDFHAHSHSDSLTPNVDPNLPKMASVVGILSHLAVQHSDCLEQALWSLVQASLKSDATALQLSGPLYILHLSSASGILARAATNVFISYVTVDVLGHLTIQLMQHRPATQHDINSLFNLIVHLLMKSDHKTMKLLQFLLNCASLAIDESSESMKMHSSIQRASASILNHLLLELQRAVNRRSCDQRFESPMLLALNSSTSVGQLCSLLAATDSDAVVVWLYRLLSCLALHCGESAAVDVGCQLLQSIDNVTRLHIFVQLQQDLQANYPEFLSAVVDKIIPVMTQPTTEDDCFRQLFTNFIHLCHWSSVSDSQRSARRPVVEVLSRHVDSIASCLCSAHCDSVIVLQLLSLLPLPSNADISCLTRLSHHVVSCFLTTLQQHDTKTCYMICQRCIQYFACLADSNSGIQAGILRLLIESALSKEFAALFGGKSSGANLSEAVFCRLDKDHSSMLSENQSLRASSLPRVFHSGVIGHRLHPATADTAVPVNTMHNRQLLLEALWTCSCRRVSSRPAAAVDSANKDVLLGSTVIGDVDRRLSAEVAKHIAQTLVELVTPDVMYNDIPWPEEDFVHVTIERDLVIWKCFEENPIIWDILEFLSTGVGAMKYCSCLLRSCMASLINQWESSREKLAKNQPKLLATTCRVIEFMRKGQLLPEPLCYTGDILHCVSSYEVYLLLVNIWTYVKDNAPLPGTRLNNGCASHYTDVIRSVMQNNIGQLGHLYVLFFPPIAVATSETNN